MSRSLLITVRFHDGRYHGVGDWPPGPARLFQALVAGAARGGAITEGDRAALAWLEALSPPIIAAPVGRRGAGFKTYVPNNDLDAVGGDPARIGEIRAPKSVKPRLFDDGEPFVYVWTCDEDGPAERHAEVLSDIACRLYQLGRGQDMAWASTEFVDAGEVVPRLAQQAGRVYRPGGALGTSLLCPAPGSLDSLERRFAASRRRFRDVQVGRAAQRVFTQPPKALFRSVTYDSPPVRLLFDLRDGGSTKSVPAFMPWPLIRMVGLVERVRDSAAQRLIAASAARKAEIERILVGREATSADLAQRIRIVPLPSIGHAHVDHAIRRVLVEIPPDCPIAVADLAWTFSGLDLGIDYVTGEILREGLPVLTSAADHAMLDQYGLSKPATRWHTIAPAALPQAASRRRMDPARLKDRAEHKGARERAIEEARAHAAVQAALRHAGLTVPVAGMRVQREPFTGKSARAEGFATGTRFAKERLWHVDLTFASAVPGPLVIGDGRYLGLGLMAPSRESPRAIYSFDVARSTDIAVADRAELLRAIRRALMALARNDDGSVPVLFSGHEIDGGSARSGEHRHIFLAAVDLDGDSRIDCVIVAAPWTCDRTAVAGSRDSALFADVVSSLTTVRAGRLGVVTLRDQGSPEANPLLGPATLWESHTDYRPTRYASRSKDAATELLADISMECRRRSLPIPAPEILNLSVGPNGAATARLRLRFAVAVSGPLLLGRDSHRGGGVFLPAG